MKAIIILTWKPESEDSREFASSRKVFGPVVAFGNIEIVFELKNLKR
jgi:hypothetical protein